MAYLRRLGLTLTMTILILVTLFPSYVKADVQLSQEFVEPIKNWSFEEIGSSVCECPPWESSNGGYRDPRSDVNGDGKVTSSDIFYLQIVVTKIAKGILTKEEALAQYPQCDVNGDGQIRSSDILAVYIDVSKYVLGQKTINCLDGKYSWYTSGGGDYLMWQYLDSDVINMIKRHGATFAFYFLPESVASDGSQNYARAEIRYWYIYDDPYHGPRTAVVQENGDWVYPKETKWHAVSVLTWVLPSTTYYVKVVIHGKQDFKAWIDYTSLSIAETKYVQDDNPDREISLAVNLFEMKDYGLPVYPYRAFLGVAMCANFPKITEGTVVDCKIDYTELKIKLVSGGAVTIWNVTQSNDKDYITDPDQTEEIQNRWIVASQNAIKVFVAVGTFLVPQLGAYRIGNLLLSLSGVGATSLLLSTYRSDADVPTADDPGEYAKAGLQYGSGVNFANERCILELALGSSCQIEVTAKATFWVLDMYAGQYYLPPLETSILVSVSL